MIATATISTLDGNIAIVSASFSDVGIMLHNLVDRRWPARTPWSSGYMQFNLTKSRPKLAVCISPSDYLETDLSYLKRRYVGPEDVSKRVIVHYVWVTEPSDICTCQSAKLPPFLWQSKLLCPFGHQNYCFDGRVYL